MGISSTLSSGMTVPLTAPLTSVFPDQRPAPAVDAVCYETVYDGVDDSFKSTDASLEISGEQTYEFECYIGSGAGHHYIFNSRATVTGEGGLYFTYHDSGALQFFCTLFSTTGTGYRQAFLKTLPSPTLNWKKVVIVSSSSSLDFYIDGVAADVFAGTGSFTMGTPNNGITLGGDNFGGDFANVRTRKFAMHSGAATNAADYSSGVDSTLLGVTEVARSNDGGTTWETGQSFTKSGDPTRQLCT